MTWTDVAENPEPVMPLLKRRFPELRRSDVTDAGADRDRLARRLARRHELTLNEARDQIEDALFVAELRRARRRCSKSGGGPPPCRPARRRPCRLVGP